MDNQTADPTEDALNSNNLTGMHEWQVQHPTASLIEIEQALVSLARRYAPRSGV
jgi:hypothetical protein